MSDHETIDPELDDELRTRLQALAREVAEHADVEAALERVRRRPRPPAVRLLAVAACLLAVVALAVALRSEVVGGTDPARSPQDDCVHIAPTQPTTTAGGPMKPWYAIPIATAASTAALLAACSDDGPTTLAEGEDVALVGNDGLGGQTLDIEAQEEDGEVTGEVTSTTDATGEVFVLTVECASTEHEGFVVLGGRVTAPEDVAFLGSLNAYVFREGEPDAVDLVGNDTGAESCAEILEAVPADLFAEDAELVAVESGDVTIGDESD